MRAQERSYKLNHSAIKFLQSPYMMVTFSNLTEMSTFCVSFWILADTTQMTFPRWFLPFSFIEWLHWARCLGFWNALGTVPALEELPVLCGGRNCKYPLGSSRRSNNFSAIGQWRSTVDRRMLAGGPMVAIPVFSLVLLVFWLCSRNQTWILSSIS